MTSRVAALLALVSVGGLVYLAYALGSDHAPDELIADAEARPELLRTLHERRDSSAIEPSSLPRFWTRTPMPLDVQYSWGGDERTLSGFLEETRSMGFMVLRDGGIVYETYALGADHESIFPIGSASESYTGTLVGIALQQGRIESLDDPVEKYASAFEGTDYGRVRIRDLLMKTSGMDFSPSDGSIYWDHIWMYMNTHFLGKSLDEFTRNIPARSEPGEKFNYTVPDSHVLSAVVRGAWGDEKTYAQIVQEELWEPFGFGGEAFWSRDASGAEGHSLGQCCLSVRLQEFAQLGQIYLENGSFRGQRLFPEDWADRAGRPANDFMEPSKDGPYPHLGYGFQFWVPLGFDDEFAAWGAFGQFLWIDRRNQVVIAQVSAEDVNGANTMEERLRVYRAVADLAMTTRPFETKTARDDSDEASQADALRSDAE